MNSKRAGLILIIIFFLVFFYAFDIARFLDIDFLKQKQQSIADLVDARPLFMMAGYVIIYIIATALSIPGAVVLTLLGGAVFGFWLGLILISFASTIGATLAFLASRYLFRDIAINRVGSTLNVVNSGIENEGAYYLFGLRLVPIFPFFLINLVMGLTSMPAKTFYWVSQIGMLPGTAIYVNAGKQLATLEGVGGIFTPQIIFSFALLAIFPIAVKKLMAYIKSRKTLDG